MVEAILTTKLAILPDSSQNWHEIMKALRFSGFGPPSVLRIEEVAIPEPGEGEALVQVKAAGDQSQRLSRTSRDTSRTQPCREPPAGTLRALL
jgi:hypothetical protein